MRHVAELAAWAILTGAPLLAPLAERVAPYVIYRPFPWDQQQREDGGQE